MSIENIAPEAQALVCIVNRPADFARLRDEGWYRIPLATAPATMAEYLAFYQTAACAAERWLVRYLAEVRSVRIVLRRDLLPKEPRHPRAGERYYRFTLGPLMELPLAIPSRRLRRVTFIPTTIGQLLHARDVVDLWRPPETSPDWGGLWGAGVNARRSR